MFKETFENVQIYSYSSWLNSNIVLFGLIVITDIMEVTSLFSSFITQIQNIQSVWKIHLLAQNMVNLYFQKKYLIILYLQPVFLAVWHEKMLRLVSYLISPLVNNLIFWVISLPTITWAGWKNKCLIKKFTGTVFYFEYGLGYSFEQVFWYDSFDWTVTASNESSDICF